MTESSSQMLAVRCPGCGAEFHIGRELADKQGRCAKCGQVFRVPKMPSAITPAHAARRASPAAPDAPLPQYIGVSCRVCQTRMYGRPDQVGKSVKCPDCGALTVVPAPTPAKPKKQPAALEGEQYELWGPDEAPPIAEMLAAQPKYIGVACRMCQTLMHATEDQVGRRLKCPDCGTGNVVPPPATIPRHDVLALGGDLELDAAADSVQPPQVFVPPRRPMLYEEEQEAARRQRSEETAGGRRRGPRYDARGRPILPRWPLITGVWRMLVTQEVVGRWILLSIVFGFSGQLLGEALFTPLQGQAEAIKMLFAVAGIALAGVWLAMAAPLMVAIVCDSADGNDQLHQPPQLMAFDWFNELLSVVMAASVAGLCGLGAWQLVQLAPLGSVASNVIVAAVVVAVLPVTLLSTLLEGSPLDVVSLRVLRSFGHCAGSWLLFYFQSYAVAALVGGAWWITLTAGSTGGQLTTAIWIVAPLSIAALLLFARLLGRLGWKLAVSMPETTDEAATRS